MKSWFRPVDTTGNNMGINDSSYYTFRDARYEGLARETAQNSLDERYDDSKPVEIEFKLFNVPTEEIPDLERYKQMYKDGLAYWENDNQVNAKVFFEEALKVLSKDKVKVLRISDFNTNGVLGSKSHEIQSASDITPWHNLLKSEGSSSKGGTQAGSFGIGKNATFANSILRSVIYSTYDKEKIKGNEGVAKLATVVKDGVTYSSKCFYGEIMNNKSKAIDGLFNLDNSFQRDEYGTDIFILGFEDDKNWEIRMMNSILSDFIIPINNNDLEVNLNGEKINKYTVGELFNKYIDYCTNNKMKAIFNEFQSSKNYYSVLISDESKEFAKVFDSLGTATLKVLYNPEFERKVLRTRQTGMKLFDRGGISSTIGFSGIVKLEGEKLNKLFREMENPAHTKWSADNIMDPKRRKEGENREKELNSWIRKTILDNATDQSIDSMDVIGLSEYLPSQLTDDIDDESEEKVDKITSAINDISVKKADREKFKEGNFVKETKEFRGAPDDDGESGGTHEPSGDPNKEDGGQGSEKDGKVGKGNQSAYKKVKSADYQPRLIKRVDYYTLILRTKRNSGKIKIKVFIAGETLKLASNIVEAVNRDTLKSYEFNDNEIIIKNVKKKDVIPIKFKLEGSNDYSLEVEIYEDK